MSGIPDVVRALAELSPVEDVILAVLRQGLPGITVGSLLAVGQVFPFVLVRRGSQIGEWNGDPRFTDAAEVLIHTFAVDPDGDEDAAILAEAVRVVLRNAWLSHLVVPGRGHITRVTMTDPPRRVADWATATGPVQYADLPTGVWRYETAYRVEIRKPRTRPYQTP
jgi:hypothetical protein